MVTESNEILLRASYVMACKGRWPAWGNNAGDFFISSLAPLHFLQNEGAVDKHIKFVPVTDGLKLPHFYHLWLAPLSWNSVRPILTLEGRKEGIIHMFFKAQI